MPPAAARRSRSGPTSRGLGPVERRYWIKKAGWQRQTHLAKALREQGFNCADITLSAVLDQKAVSDVLERHLAKIIADAMRMDKQRPPATDVPSIVDYVFPERLARAERSTP